MGSMHRTSEPGTTERKNPQEADMGIRQMGLRPLFNTCKPTGNIFVLGRYQVCSSPWASPWISPSGSVLLISLICSLQTAVWTL